MNRNKNSTRLGVDRVKPGNSVRINLFLGLRGPDIRLGLNNRHLILEGHRRSWKVMESQGRSRKVMDGLFQSLDWHIRWENLWVDGVVLGGVVACRIIVSVPVPVPVPFLWTLDSGFETWIWDWTWAWQYFHSIFTWVEYFSWNTYV